MSVPDKERELFGRHLGFVLFLVASASLFWRPLGQLISFSLTRDYGAHILLVAPASAYFIYLKRRAVFSKNRPAIVAGGSLFLGASIVGCQVLVYSHLHGDYLFAEILALVALWISGFILCYGTHAFRIARFPLLFLLLLVPIPDFLVDKAIFLLQVGSAASAYWILRFLGIPVFKQGIILQLPTLDIEVARQCSGIRSSLALLITTLLVGQFILRSGWRKTLFILSIVPILILKNGARIVAVSLLAIYVDRGFLHGWLHTSGGVLFYLLGLVMLSPIMIALRKSEDKHRTTPPQNADFSSADVVSLKG